MNEYSQLKSNDEDHEKLSNNPVKTTTTTTISKNESNNNNENSPSLETKSTLLNNQIESNVDDKPIMINGGNKNTNSTPSSPNSSENDNQHSQSPSSSSSVNEESKSKSPVPSYWLDEVRRLNNDKNHLETRKSELEKCNKLLELQLNQFKTYINTTGTLDQRTKQKLANRIQEAEKLLDEQQRQIDQNLDNDKQLSSKNRNEDILKFDDDDNDDESIPMKSSQLSTYHQPLLHTAADRLDIAVESLVDVLNQSDDDDDIDRHFEKMTNGQQQQQSSVVSNR